MTSTSSPIVQMQKLNKHYNIQANEKDRTQLKPCCLLTNQLTLQCHACAAGSKPFVIIF